jgi:hypothetical protein
VDHNTTYEEEEGDIGAVKTGDNQPEETEPAEIKRALPHFDSEEEFKNVPEFTLRDKYNYLKRKTSELVANKEHVENELAKAKIRWAEIELQNDNTALRLN